MLNIKVIKKVNGHFTKKKEYKIRKIYFKTWISLITKNTKQTNKSTHRILKA